jgi:hypothetical protein
VIGVMRDGPLRTADWTKVLFTLAAMLPQTALCRGGFAASSAKLDSSSGNDDHRFQLSIQYKLIR